MKKRIARVAKLDLGVMGMLCDNASVVWFATLLNCEEMHSGVFVIRNRTIFAKR